MISILEQRQIIESAFLPFNCRCSIEADETMTLEIRAPGNDRVLLRTEGIRRSELSSSRSISQLVLRLRQELEPQEAASPARQMGSLA